MTDFVLIHGAWHGGWAWRDVANIMRADGHTVFTPSLTGLSDRRHLLTDAVGVELHAQDIRSLIEAEELKDVVLVGHSYGARPTALACDLSVVRKWISLDGVPVREQATLFDGASEQVIQASRAACVDVGAPAIPPYPAEVIGVPVDHAGHDWVNRRQTPMPWRCLAEEMPALPERFADLPKAYILALGNTLAGAAQGADQARAVGWPMIEIDSGHDLMVTAAEETAKALLALTD